MSRWLFVPLLSLLAVACGERERSTSDSGIADAAVIDAAVDVGARDAATHEDGGDCNSTGCPTGLTCCASAVTPPTCVDIQSEHGHCGMCALRCGVMYECVGGACQPR